MKKGNPGLLLVNKKLHCKPDSKNCSKDIKNKKECDDFLLKYTQV